MTRNVWILTLFLASCATRPATQGPPADAECVDNAGCDIGQVCDEAWTCQNVGCLASDDCSFDSVCDVTTFECVTGCARDADCLASEACDLATSTCVARGCSDTHRDCAVGEICQAGACITAPGDWCTECTGRPLACGASQHCVAFDGSSGSFCFNGCRNDGDCPSGFECLQIDLQPGGPTKMCYANCGFLSEGGFF